MACKKAMLYFQQIVIACLAFYAVRSEEGVRHFLYSIKAGEGFNLRRDAHMRAATLVKALTEASGEKWVLVLPPWPLMPHWRTEGRSGEERTSIKWGMFFDLPSLSQYVPSLEFEDFLRLQGKNIGMVYQLLQGFDSSTKWEEKAEVVTCPGDSTHSQSYRKLKDGRWKVDLFGVKDVVIKTKKCISVMGFTETILPQLLEDTSGSVLVENLEQLMHAQFGGLEYWKSRSSMVYADHLREEGNKFMSANFHYTPKSGHGREGVAGGGGNYLSVHLRRGDYLYARPNDIPSISGAANQMNMLLERHNLRTVFLATDAGLAEKEELKKLLKGHAIWYAPSESDLGRYRDGGVAIIDQWIAAHGKVFVGSYESTFSFRIREDRQLMGFSKESTFNQLCGIIDDENDPDSCAPPTYWEMPKELSHRGVDGSSLRTQSEL